MNKKLLLFFIIILMMVCATACNISQQPAPKPTRIEPSRRPTRDIFVDKSTTKPTLSPTASPEIIKPEITTDSNYPPIVYTKDDNIYAYYPELGHFVQVTDRRAEAENSNFVGYGNSHVSPDGRFVAFDKQHTGTVIISSLETGQEWSLSVDDPLDRYSKTVIGWDKNNLLYLARKIVREADQDASSEESFVKVIYRYDLRDDTLSYYTELPVVETVDGLWTTVKGLSESGRYIAYTVRKTYEVGSNQILLDAETGQIQEVSNHGLFQISNKEDRIAFASMARFEENRNIYVAVRDIDASDAVWYIDNFDLENTIWGNPYWSYDDRYLLISQSNYDDVYSEFDDPSSWSTKWCTEMLIIDTQNPGKAAVYLTTSFSEDAFWSFGGWSPSDHRLVLIQQIMPMTGLQDLEAKLWLFDFSENTVLLIDQGTFIVDADW